MSELANATEIPTSPYDRPAYAEPITRGADTDASKLEWARA